MKTNKLLIPFAVAALAIASLSASANTITIDTPSGSTLGGLPISAEAVFTTSANDLKITLRNFQNDPTSVIQSISGLSFALTSGQTSGSLLSSSGMERTIAANGTYVNGATVAAGWSLTGLKLNDLGAAGPTHTLIGGPNGSNIYGNGNGSIDGNGAHNPFLAGDVTFDLFIQGVNVDSSIKDVLFFFGTENGTSVGSGPPTRNVPDGGMTLMLLGAGLSGLGLVRKTVKK